MGTWDSETHIAPPATFAADYGNPDKADEFKWVWPYSPLHNVRVPQDGSQQYPAMILATGDHDDR